MISEDIKEFCKVVGDYEGTLEVDENIPSVTFKANNLCTKRYNTGEIHTSKVVECSVNIEPIKMCSGEVKTRLEAHERTYEIIGGHSCDYSKEQLLIELQRYNFKRKQHELTLFDFL